MNATVKAKIPFLSLSLCCTLDAAPHGQKDSALCQAIHDNLQQDSWGGHGSPHNSPCHTGHKQEETAQAKGGLDSLTEECLGEDWRCSPAQGQVEFPGKFWPSPLLT